MQRKHIFVFIAALSSGFVSVPAFASAWLGHFADAPSLTKQDEEPAGTWRAIKVTARPVGTSANAPQGTIQTAPLVVDGLQFRGALILNSHDRAFGGFSGLRLSDDGGNYLYAVSDRGQWFTAEVKFDAQNAIAELQMTKMATMMRDDGAILSGVPGDAEALELTSDGGAIVGFERYHRLDHYLPDASGRFAYRQRILHNRLAKGLRDNGSLESVLLLNDGRVLTIAEDTISEDYTSDERGSPFQEGDRPGWLSPPNIWYQGGDDWRPLAYRPSPEFSVTDLAQDETTGDVFVLERAYSPGRLGVRVRIKRLPVENIEAGAIVQGTEIAFLTMVHGIDNLEAMDVRRTTDGRLMLYLMSDDNFSIAQRTILMSWEVLE